MGAAADIDPAAAAGGQQGGPAAVAAALGIPFTCHYPRCKMTGDSVSPEWIRRHIAGHEYTEKKEREALVKRQQQRAKQIQAAGPSLQRNIHRRKENKALQRAAAKGNGGGGPGKKAARGRQ